ncbi:malate dehydrogenase, chloroplastic [Selaginella moellendorffii]|nr:malate dehydrogenase, chloroplastic [Selaginella moellendorffii]|eukprot:XP_002991213.2 malate dehydrogenase, chloroplastic [Selaginella moellendorffii]
MAAAAAATASFVQAPVSAKHSGGSPSLSSRPAFQSFIGMKSSGECRQAAFFRGDMHDISLRNHKPLVTVAARNADVRPRAAATYKAAVLGAGGGIGQPLSLLLKMSPLLSHLNLYDIANVKGVAADLSHCNTPSLVTPYTGAEELAESLKGVDLIIIPAGVPRKPGMTRDDLFNINAGIVKTLVEAAADYAPKAWINIISNPVNSTVPIAAEVLKKKGVFDPKKLFGVTTLDVVRANTFVAQQKTLRLIDVDVPVVGGHAGITILPLLSKTRPKTEFTQEEIEKLTVRIQNAGTEVVEAKAGAGSATLSMAYAAARFAESCLRAIDGDADVYECTYVKSDVMQELPFFASRVKLGKDGVEAFVHTDIRGLTEYEEKALQALIPELKGSIEKGINFVNKQPAAASV